MYCINCKLQYQGSLNFWTFVLRYLYIDLFVLIKQYKEMCNYEFKNKIVSKALF